MTEDKFAHCFEGKDLNPKTCSFSKSCKEGYKRDSDFKCVKDNSKIVYVKKINDVVQKIQNGTIRKSDLTRIINQLKKDFTANPELNIGNEISSLEEFVKKYYSEPGAKTYKKQTVAQTVEQTEQGETKIVEKKKRKESLEQMKKKLTEIEEKINLKQARRSNITRQINVFKEKMLPENNLDKDFERVVQLLDEKYPMKNPVKKTTQKKTITTSKKENVKKPNIFIPFFTKQEQEQFQYQLPGAKKTQTKKKVLFNNGTPLEYEVIKTPEFKDLSPDSPIIKKSKKINLKSNTKPKISLKSKINATKLLFEKRFKTQKKVKKSKKTKPFKLFDEDNFLKGKLLANNEEKELFGNDEEIKPFNRKTSLPSKGSLNSSKGSLNSK